VRIIRVPCSGRVDPQFILRAFQNKADGVIVAGCLEGGCHYVDGNIKAKKRVESLKKALDAIGLSGDRLELYFMSSAMSDKFVEAMTEFTARIKRLGKSPLRM
jgi:coenzyme F420-reducing hydrogenase delta subunit